MSSLENFTGLYDLSSLPLKHGALNIFDGMIEKQMFVKNHIFNFFTVNAATLARLLAFKPNIYKKIVSSPVRRKEEGSQRGR